MGEKVLDHRYCSVNNIGVDCTAYAFPSGNNPYHTYINKINAMPQDEIPQIFGFHPNADITKNLRLSEILLSLLRDVGDVEGVKCSVHDDENVSSPRNTIQKVSASFLDQEDDD